MEPLSVAQQRASEFFEEQCDRISVAPPNEQNNVLLVLSDTHLKPSEAGVEIARFLIDPSGYILWATFMEGHGQEFAAMYDDYIAHVGIVHKTEYPHPAHDSSSGQPAPS